MSADRQGAVDQTFVSASQVRFAPMSKVGAERAFCTHVWMYPAVLTAYPFCYRGGRPVCEDLRFGIARG